MRGFDKLEEGRSRVLVYQVGSNRLYTRMLLDGCIRWIVRWIVRWIHIRSQWMLVESIGSMCILGGSMYILVDLSWIHVYLSGSQLDPCVSSQIQLDPCISQQSLYRPQYIHYQILVDPCRSLVYPLVSLYTHSIPINPLYPYQSTLIHSYPPYPSILYLLISILCNRSILPSSSRHY